MRRFLSASIATTVVLATLSAPAMAGGTTLTDLSGHWARAQVESGVAAGFITGYPDRSFRPNQPITRAEFFKLLAGALRYQPKPSADTGFGSTRHWAFEQGWVQTAVLNGLLYPPDYGPDLGPNVAISRREIVLAAVRALGKQPLVDEKNAMLAATDASSYAPWLKGWAVIAMGDRIMTGYPDGSLGLNTTATRAEALVMVERILAKVTLDLAPADAPGQISKVRHPAAGEPFWWYSGNVQQTGTISNGTQSYTFGQKTWGVQLKPAPGRAVWVTYVMDGKVWPATVDVLGYLKDGKMTEVARYDGRAPQMLAVDSTGRLWLHNNGALMIASPNGQPKSISAVDGEVYAGDFDGGGAFWTLATKGWPQVATLYRVTPEGAATAFPLHLQNKESVNLLAVGADGAVWLTIQQPVTMPFPSTTPFLTVAKYVDGTLASRTDLLKYYQAGSDAAGMQVVGRNGPFVWMQRMNKVDQWTAVPTGFYRLDLTSGAFTPMVVPRTVAGYHFQQAPDGGVLVKDDAGKFWRVMP